MKHLLDRKALFASTILVFFLAISAVTFFMIRNHYRYVFAAEAAENRLTADLLSTLIYQHQKAAIGILESFIYDNPGFLKALEAKDRSAVISGLECLSKSHGQMDALFVTDGKGNLWANYPVDETGYGTNLSWRDWYKGVSRSWKPYISGIYRRIVFEKGLAVALAVPVLDRKGNVKGILCAAHRADFLEKVIRENTANPRKNIDVLDQYGNIIYSSTSEYRRGPIPCPIPGVIALAAAGGRSDTEIRPPGTNDETSYVSIAPVKEIGWSVVVSHGRNAIHASLYGYTVRTAAVAFLLFVFLSTFFFLFSYRQKKAEELVLAQDKYRSIFDNAMEGIYQTTADGRIINANPAFARIFGYRSPDEFITQVTDIGQQVYADPNDRARVLEILEKDGEIRQAEFPGRKKDGSRLWLSINARTVRDKNGKTICYEGSVQDITELKRLETHLRHAQKTEAIGTLAGGIAHDFNNILTSLMGYASLMRKKIDGPGVMGTYLDEILAASQKAADLTKALLAFSRQQPLRFEALDANRVVSEIKDILKKVVVEKIVFNVVLGAEDAVVMADRTQLDQVLFNLVTNARDAMPQGGTLTIETGTELIDEDFIRGHGFGTAGRYATITVSDTGTGIDHEIQSKIFDPFFTTKEIGKGTGLGLSMVYGIVKQHRGFITVLSEPGKGSAFRIFLPAVHDKARENSEPLRHAFPRGTETVLIAEDDDRVRAYMREALEHYGYTIVEARDGQEAVDAAREHPGIDIAIIDSVMPRKNGREAYEEIRTIAPRMKVIFASGYTRDMVLNKGVEDGGFHFIAKPLQLDRFLTKIRDVLDRE